MLFSMRIAGIVMYAELCQESQGASGATYDAAVCPCRLPLKAAGEVLLPRPQAEAGRQARSRGAAG